MSGDTNNTGSSGSLNTKPSWAGGPVSGSGDPKVFGSQLLGDIQANYNQGPGQLPTQLYAGLGQDTLGGLNSMLGVNTGDYTNGLYGALSDYANKAAGNGIGINDPAYEAMRSKLASDVMGQVGSSYSNAGRFGGGSYVNQATDALTSSLGGLDYQQYLNGVQQQQQALQNLPGIYQALLAPGQMQLGVGATLDQDRQAQLDAQNQLLDMKNNQGYDQLAKYVSLLQNGTGGQTNNLAGQTPWWQTVLGTGVTLLGDALSGGIHIGG